jgi:hypothetical protein
MSFNKEYIGVITQISLKKSTLEKEGNQKTEEK